MIDAFVEGVRSIVQVCHLVILVPVALTVVAARGRWQAVVGAVCGVVVGGFVFVTSPFGNITDLQLRVTAVLVIVGVAALAGARLAHPPLRRGLESPWTAAATAAAIGVMVTQWWRPCVGVQLGDILTNAPDHPWSQLLPTVGFMIGLTTPLIVIGLIYAAWPPNPRVTTRLGWVGSGLVVVLGLSVLVGQHGEIVSRLLEWSQ